MLYSFQIIKGSIETCTERVEVGFFVFAEKQFVIICLLFIA